MAGGSGQGERGGGGGDFACRLGDLGSEADAAAVVASTAAYALDPCSGRGPRAAPLPPETLEALVPAMRRHGNVFVVLAVGEGAAEGSLGHATCVLSFSTYAAAPVLNVHDVFVRAEHRCKGVGRALLEVAMAEGRRRGARKATLEVLNDNAVAEALYRKVGFEFGMKFGERAL